jgi:ribosomal protein L11 methyltransferase
MTMILWQKQATAEWLAFNEPQLEEIAGLDLAVIARPGRTRSLVQAVCPRRAKAERLQRNFGGTVKVLPSKWSPVSPPHPPIRIGRRLEIVSEPTPSPGPDNKLQLLIPAAGAFGTGEHATTAMSLRLLEEATRKLPTGWRLLDAGTGTGILALAARRLGAAEVFGLDIGPHAVAHACQNARLNHIGRTKFITADILRWKPHTRYEVVTANLYSELLVAALPILRRALRSSGCLIVSGILREQTESVVHALAKARFRLVQQRRRGKWIALLAFRKS